MNRNKKTNSKVDTKAKKKSNVVIKGPIENYFGKKKCSIYLERLEEEKRAIEKSNGAGGEEKVEQINAESNENTDEQNAVEFSGSNLAELLTRIDFLEKKYKLLEHDNTKLMKDNGALKKMLEQTKWMCVYKDIIIQKLEVRLALINDDVSAQKNFTSNEAPVSVSGENVPINKQSNSKKAPILYSGYKLSAKDADELRSINWRWYLHTYPSTSRNRRR